jgi:Tfp pilus assembly protein PilF
MRSIPDLRLSLAFLLAVGGCMSPSPKPAASIPDDPSPVYRNVVAATAYAGDSACSSCHLKEASVYAKHAMAQSFHPWSAGPRVETTTATPIHSEGSGYSYEVIEDEGRLSQVEFIKGPDGRRTHELRRRMDFVMGSGKIGRSYFTQENGRLFQLPLTWYREKGWDFSPGYQTNNGRFDRLLPDRCIACHSSYPKPLPHLEGKYAELHSGIGCERCHGPGALHVAERRAGVKPDSGFDHAIVNPAHLSIQRRMDVCEQCHVHTTVAVLREGKNAFSFLPSQSLRDLYAFFRVSGTIDIVSHADRLRQSKCFIATQNTARPLECATCHNPHDAPSDPGSRSRTCLGCHTPTVLQQKLARSTAAASHSASSDCVACHMPREQERAVHGAFTEHWIRVVPPGSERAAPPRYSAAPIEPYYDRDRSGPDAAIYQGMGEIVYATLANDRHILADGIAALDSALGQHGARADAHFLLGVASQQLGFQDDAIRALEQAARIDSARPETLRALAQAYIAAGRPADQIDRLYERALAAQPALAWMRAEYAQLLDAQGRPRDAEKAYRAAVEEQPSLAGAWFGLGALLVSEGKLPESTKAFGKAVHLDPRMGEALSPLIEFHATPTSVESVRDLPSAFVHDRGSDLLARPVSAGASMRGGDAGVEFTGVAPVSRVDISRPDGTLIRSIAAGSTSVHWDLKADGGAPVAGGLYRATVVTRDVSGRSRVTQLYVGLVRR